MPKRQGLGSTGIRQRMQQLSQLEGNQAQTIMIWNAGQSRWRQKAGLENETGFKANGISAHNSRITPYWRKS
ncbi:MAG: hypothetical protein ACFCUR_11535 [Rhodomicrobiaceae bacterium]